MRPIPSRHIELLILTILVIIYVAWFMWPIIGTGADSLRLVSVFNSDESTYAGVVRQALSRNSLSIEREDQGHLYINFLLFPLHVLNAVHPVSDRFIIVGFRLISAMFGAATLIVSFVLARRYFGRVAGWLSASFLAVISRSLWRFSAMVHSDVTQVFFLALGIYFCCRLAEEGALQYVVLAAASAGCAFATKYAGILLLPMVWLVIIVQSLVYDDRELFGRLGQKFVSIAWAIVVLGGLLLAATSVALTPEVVGYHADISYGIAEGGHWANLWGVLRFPIIATGCGLALLSVIFRVGRPASHLVQKVVVVLSQLIVSCVTFAVVVFLSAPLSIGDLVKGLFFQFLHVGFGHNFQNDATWNRWIQVVHSPDLFSGLLLILAFLSLCLTLYGLWKEGKRKLLAPDLIVWIWVFCYSLFVFTQVNKTSAHYLLPIVPPVMILASRPPSLVLKALGSKRVSKAVALLVFLAGVALAVEMHQSASQVLGFRQDMAARERNNVHIEAGEWLAANYPPFVHVMYDVYSFVPPSFAHAAPQWAGSLTSLADLSPDIVVVNDNISGRFQYPGLAERYYLGAESFDDTYQYYKLFADNTMPGYELVSDFGNVRIYARERADYVALFASNRIETQEGSVITLRGYGLVPGVIEPGQTLRVELFWESSDSLPHDAYAVFLHLRDRARGTVAQADAAQVDWQFLTDKQFATFHDLSLPGSAVPGQYEIRTGLYRPDNMGRLPVLEDTSGENAILVSKILVQ